MTTKYLHVTASNTCSLIATHLKLVCEITLHYRILILETFVTINRLAYRQAYYYKGSFKYKNTTLQTFDIIFLGNKDNTSIIETTKKATLKIWLTNNIDPIIIFSIRHGAIYWKANNQLWKTSSVYSSDGRDMRYAQAALLWWWSFNKMCVQK